MSSKGTAKLRVVPDDEPRDIPAPDLSYEHRERQRIASRDWAALHRWSDRNPPLWMPDRLKRIWR